MKDAKTREEPVAQLDARELCDWAESTFPHSTPQSIVAHLRREVDELQHEADLLCRDPKRHSLGPILGEIADCYLLLLHLCRKLDVDLSLLGHIKFQVLKARQWGEPDHEGVVEHIRDEPKEETAGV